MKSGASGQVVKTNCKNCAFSIYEGDTQTDCLANRIEKFKKQGCVVEAYDDDKEFYVVDRLCNLFRDTKPKNVDQELAKAKKDVQLTFDVILDCTGMDRLTDCIDSISNKLKYDTNKINYTIVYSNDVKLTKENREHIFALSKKLNNCKIINCINYGFTIHTEIYHSRKSFHTLIDLSDNFNNSVFFNLNNLVNEDMEKVVVYTEGDITFISNLAYKIESLEKNSAEYFKAVDDIVKKSKLQNLYVHK